MDVYLISYDLIQPGQNYEKVHAAIKAINPNLWARPLESVWLVPSNLSADQVRDRVGSVMDQSDKLMVVEISKKPIAARNLTDNVWKWIQQNV